MIRESSNPSDDEFIEVPDGSLPGSHSASDSNSEQVRNSKGQFLPGVSGNPTGRPPGIHDRRHIVNDVLEAYHQRGGVNFLTDLPADQFVSLLRLLIPKEMDINAGSVTTESVAAQVLAMQQRGGRL